jgi:hypothetical protein
MGSVTDLAKIVLEGSDWKVGENNDTLIQYKEEPLYAIVLKEELTVTSMLDSQKTCTIPTSKIIYGFYSLITEQDKYF